MIAKVEPLTTARALRGPFDYRLGEDMSGVGVGSMLVVPFARRRLLGVVVDVAEHSDVPPDKLAEPLSALEADVPPELVNLGLWVAREYVSTPARGLALVLPPGTGTGSGRRWRHWRPDRPGSAIWRRPRAATTPEYAGWRTARWWRWSTPIRPRPAHAPRSWGRGPTSGT